jgi:hypothetical protein
MRRSRFRARTTSGSGAVRMLVLSFRQDRQQHRNRDAPASTCPLTTRMTFRIRPETRNQPDSASDPCRASFPIAASRDGDDTRTTATPIARPRA